MYPPPWGEQQAGDPKPASIDVEEEEDPPPALFCATPNNFGKSLNATSVDESLARFSTHASINLMRMRFSDEKQIMLHSVRSAWTANVSPNDSTLSSCSKSHKSVFPR